MKTFLNHSPFPFSSTLRPWALAPTTYLVLLLPGLSLLLAFFSGMPGAALGAMRTWSGLGGDNNWNTAGNWTTGAPVNNDSLDFTGSTRLTSTNNISNMLVTGIGFDASGFSLFGNALTNTGGVNDNNGNNTNSYIMSLGAAQSFTNASAGTTLVFAGNITNNGFGLTIGGDGNVFLNGIVNGNASLTPSGSLTMSGGGTLRLGAAHTFAGGLTIDSGTVQLANGAAIPSGAGRGDLTVGASGTLDLNGNSQTINGLYGSGTIDNRAGTATYTLTVGNNSTNSAGNFSGVIQNTSGTTALTKINTNTLTLTSGHNYSGPTTINAGTLVLGASGSIASSSRITVAPGALLDVSTVSGGFPLGSSQTLVAGRSTNGGPNDILGSLNSSGNITLLKAAGAGTLNVSGDLSLSGGTIFYDLGSSTAIGGGTNDLIVLNGALNLSGTTTIQINPYTGFLPAGTYTLISNAQGTVTGSSANLTASAPRGISPTFDTTTTPGSVLMSLSGSFTAGSLLWNGATTGDWDVQTTQNWLNGATPDYFFNLDNAMFDDSASNTTINLPAGVAPSTTTFNNVNSNYVISGSGAISGNGTLTVKGGGTVQLNTGNIYTGDTTVSNLSTLILGILPAAPHIAVYNGSPTLGNLILGGGGVFMQDVANDTVRANFNSLVINAGGGSLSMRNRQSSSSYIYQFGSVSRNVGGTVDFNNIQQKASSPQVGLLITNTATVNGILGGFATIFENDWVVPVATGLGSIAYTGYQTNNASPTAWGAASNVVVTATPGATINSMTINSLKLPSASTITINGGQTLTLSSGGLMVPANASGAATITGGTLQGGASADLIVLQMSGGNALTIGSVIANNGGPCALTKSGQGTLILTGANTYTGPTYINGRTLNGGSATLPGTLPAGILQIGNGGTSGSIDGSSAVINNGTLTFSRSDPITFALAISGNGALRNSGSGTLTLTANNSYSGATTISAGTMQVGNGGTIGSLGNSPSVTDNGALIFNRSDNISFAGPISGTGSFTKQGAGRLSLGGTDTYQGTTTISQGTLALGATASIANSASIVVAAGATFDVSAVAGFALNAGAVNQTLSGNGVVTGSVTTVTGTKLIPGSSVGTLSFSNNLTLSGGTLQFELGSSSSDRINVAGNLTLSAGTLQLTTLNTLPNGTYKLISYSGSLSGSAANLSVSGFNQPGQVAALSSAIPGEVDLVVSAYLSRNLVWQGNGGNNFWDAGITSDWTNPAGASVTFSNFDNAIFNDTSLNLNVNLNGALTPALLTVNAAANNYTLQGSGQLAGGGLTKNNASTLTILTTNSSSGSTIINSGTLQLGDGLSAGALGTGTLNNNAAVVFNEPGDQIIPNAISGNGALTDQGPGVLSLTGNNSFTGPLTINAGEVRVGTGGTAGTLGSGPVTNNTSLTFNRSGSLSFSGGIAGSGSVSNVGVGALTLGGVNTYSGTTVIANGSLKLGASQVIPNGSGTANVLLDGGASAAGIFDLNGFNETINGLDGANNTVLSQVANNSSGTNTLTLGDADAAGNFSGRILDNTTGSGKLALTKIGAGDQVINVVAALGNAYSAGTIVNGGVLELATPNLGGGVLQNPNVNNLALGTGPVTLLSGTLQLAGYTGSTTPTYNPMFNPVIVPDNMSAAILAPSRGDFASTVTGGGSILLGVNYVRCAVSANWTAFTGWITVSNGPAGGDCRVNNAAGFPLARLHLVGSATMYSITTANSIIPIGELSGDPGTTIGGGSGGNTPAVWRAGLLNSTTNFDGNIVSNDGILKDGTGALTLNGNNTYLGVTAVTNGTLILGTDSALSVNSTNFDLRSSNAVLDVSALTASTLNLGANQTLQGLGTVRGSVTTAGNVSPGESIGTLTITNVLTLNSATLLMEINNASTPNSDKLVAQSISVSGGTLNVSNLGGDLAAGNTFVLFSGPVSGFTTINLPALPCANLAWNNKLAVDGSLAVIGTSCVNTTPTNLTIVVTGSLADVSWPPNHIGWRLQTNAVDVANSNHWFFVTGSDQTNRLVLTINPAAPKVFFRLIYP